MGAGDRPEEDRQVIGGGGENAPRLLTGCSRRPQFRSSRVNKSNLGAILCWFGIPDVVAEQNRLSACHGNDPDRGTGRGSRKTSSEQTVAREPANAIDPEIAGRPEQTCLSGPNHLEEDSSTVV